jgi:LEA14-like dessication related protein
MASVVLVTVALALSTYAAAYEDGKTPSVKLKGIALKSLDVPSLVAETTISVEIENPGPAFTVKDATYRLKLNDQEVGEGKRDEEIKVPAASSVVVDLPLSVHLGAVPGVSWRTLAGGLSLRYDVEADLNVPLLALLKERLHTSLSGDLPIGEMALQFPGKLKDAIFGKPDHQ